MCVSEKPALLHLSATAVNHLVFMDGVFALSAWFCPIISVLPVTFSQGGRKTFGLGDGNSWRGST